jgi:Polyketide cyclase / dehydrase and lipid transport
MEPKEDEMFRYASEVPVARPAREVFAAVVDIARWGEWTDMREVRPDGSGPIRVGSGGTFTMPGPFRGPIRYELTDLEMDRQVTYRIEHPAFSWTAVMGVAPEGDGSRLATSGEFRLRGVWRLLQPIVAREVSRGEATELVRLKAILESAPATAMSAASPS